ncbi:hypothetical protein CJ030_MR2G013663 [Morella rubra]|uniref:Uncharacterized protein n=1 Tax=Morella rubra TaxID=262757 RepID=A0A6A1WCS9_9ROSI|nr:hypothetical protein CJ030_MR2G013663 [Morella rubra]
MALITRQCLLTKGGLPLWFSQGESFGFFVTSLNTRASAPNSAKKFFELYGWSGLSDVEPIQILRVVMDDPNLTDVVKLEANDLNVYWRLLHHMVCNIILPRIGKFEYVILLDLFVMYCLITLEMGGEEKENPKESKEYNKKTPMLMGFIENENGEWVKKGVVTPQKGGPESNEDDEVEAEEPEGVVAGEATPHPATSLAPTSSSRVDPSVSYEPQLVHLEASLMELKYE